MISHLLNNTASIYTVTEALSSVTGETVKKFAPKNAEEPQKDEAE